MLKRIIFLMVLISSITTPTKAYEAYSIQTPIFQSPYQSEKFFTPLPVVANSLQTGELCSSAITAAETAYGIKKDLLQTIAIVESGKWNTKTGKRTAWPWTVHANGKGYYYATKEKAVAAVKSMQKRGITNIDVGCMQINLKYHGTAFQSLEDAFDPEKNVTYSAKFIKKLYKQTKKDWKKTAMFYHSKNRKKGINYKNRLEKNYTQYINPTAATPLF